MKLSDFNSWSLIKKEDCIKTFTTGKPFVSGALVFEYYTITAVYSLNGKLIQAELGAHDEKLITEARKLLKGLPVFVIDGNSFPKVREAITQKIFNATNRNN